jgi:hypothetical protein
VHKRKWTRCEVRGVSSTSGKLCNSVLRIYLQSPGNSQEQSIEEVSQYAYAGGAAWGGRWVHIEATSTPSMSKPRAMGLVHELPLVEVAMLTGRYWSSVGGV